MHYYVTFESYGAVRERMWSNSRLRIRNGAPTMRVGDRVYLRTPDNIRLDGATAQITEITEWGAHCSTQAAATGQFRATWDEMEPAVTFTGDPCVNCGSMRMRITGTCRVCEDCGESGGC